MNGSLAPRPAPQSKPVPLSPAPSGVTQVAPEVTELAWFALAHAVNSVVPDGGTMAPFTLTHSPTGNALARFIDSDGTLERPRAHLAASGGTRGALSWDGYLTFEGVRTDALFAQASDAGQPSVVYAQRYAENETGKYLLGERLLVAYAEPLL